MKFRLSFLLISLIVSVSCNSISDSKTNSNVENTVVAEANEKPTKIEDQSEIVNPTSKNTKNIFEGMYTYMADANMFVSCDKKIKMSVEMKGEYLNLERQYLRTVDGGVEVYVRLKGHIKKGSSMDGDKKIDALVIEEILELSKDKKCP